MMRIRVFNRIIKFILLHYKLFSALFFLLAICMFSFASSLDYLPIYVKTIHLDHYDSGSLDSQLATPFQQRVHFHTPYKNIEISGDFTIRSDRNNPPYMGIFQTSKLNDGLRYELGKNGNTGKYISAIVMPNKSSPEGAIAYSVGAFPYSISPNKTYKVVITVRQSHFLDFELFEREKDKYISTHQPQSVAGNFDSIETRDVAIGSNYDETRKFQGTIENFSIKITYLIYTHISSVSSYLVPLFLLLAFLIAGIGNKQKIPSLTRGSLIKYSILAILIFVYPITQLYAVNMLNVTFPVIAKIIFFGSLLNLTLYTLLFFSYRDPNKALLILILSTIVLLFAGKIYNNISHLIQADWLIFSCLMILLVIHLIFLRSKSNYLALGNIAGKIIYLLFFMSLITVSFNSIKMNFANKQNKDVINNHLLANNKNQPDIYFIISDMHASQVSLQKHFDFKNDDFLNQLQSLGFYVAKNARSNYKYTTLSIPSMLNLSAIPQKIQQLTQVRDYYDHNELALFLKKMGYKYIFISPRRYIIEKSSIADVNLSCSKITDFEGVLWGYSLFFRVNKFGDVYRHDVLCGLDEIKQAARMPGPKFIFAHILSPHPPYVFDKDGNKVPPEKQQDTRINTSRINLNKAGYLGQLQFISKKLLETINYILAHSTSTPIIIIQGDHGFSLYEIPEFSSGVKLPPDDNINARMRPLAAYLFPRGGNKVLYDGISPMNMTRGLLRYYFHRTDLTKIADISYWSPEANYFTYTDVTKIINKQNTA